MLIKNYRYVVSYKNGIGLMLADSAYTFVSPDSQVSATFSYPVGAKAISKTTCYFSKTKQLIKQEQYTNNVLQTINEWKYDAKGRIKWHGVRYMRRNDYEMESYEYEKKNGDSLVIESSYHDGKFEFYTTDYYDRKNVHYKEIRQNQTKKDIIHVETYKYDANGRLIDKIVYFPEFMMTRHYPEKPLDIKCIRQFPSQNERIGPTKELFLKKLLQKYLPVFNGKECISFEFVHYFNSRLCKVTIQKDDSRASVSISLTEHYL